MKSPSAIILALFCLAASALCGPKSADSKDAIVLLISLGGLPASELREPAVAAPTLRRLASEGVTASRMTATDPTVTWPDHASLATGVGPGKHGVLYNGKLVRGGPYAPVQVQHCSRSEILRARTFYDLAHEAGLTTAQVGWPPCDTGATITWGFGELANSNGPVEREMIQAGILNKTDLGEVGVTTSPKRDEIWLRAVTHIITQHRPQVLLVRLTDFDAITHTYGPASPESRAAISAADSRINQILETLKRVGVMERATIFVVSDQGFKPIRRDIRPNAALRKAGLITAVGLNVMPRVVSAEAYAITGGGIANIFLTNPAHRETASSRIKEIFSGLEGVDRVIEPSGYAAAGFPSQAENNQMSDFVLTAKPGYGFIAAVGGEPLGDVVARTTVAFHGYPASDPDMDAIFIACGQHVRSGIRLDRISNLDVAPTIAQVLGLKMGNVDGKVLSEILR